MRFLLLFLVAVLSVSSAWSAELTVSGEWLYTEHRETGANGDTLNREEGGLPGVDLGVSWSLAPRWVTGVSGRFHGGTLDYSGSTQTGGALTTRTDTRYQALGGWLGYRMADGARSLALIPSLHVRQWDRDIRATASSTSLETRYRWWVPALAARLGYRFNAADRISVTARVFQNRGIEARVDLAALEAGKVDLEPEAALGQGLRLDWSRHLAGDMRLSVYGYLEVSGFEASDRVVVDAGSRRLSVREPESRHWHRGLGVGLSF